MQGFDHRSGQFYEIDDAKIYYEDKGEKSLPVLLMLHGALGNIEHFNPFIAKLPVDSFRIVGIDSRGQGKSTLGSKNLSYALFQREIENILEHLDINKLSILGFSNGGTVAYRLAAFTNLIIEGVVTIGAPWNERHLNQRQDSAPYTLEDWVKDYPSDYKFYHKFNPVPNIQQIFLQLIQLGDDFPNEAVKNVQAPLLAIRGEQDSVLSAQSIRVLSQLVKDVKVINLASVGHEILLDQPDNICQEFLSWRRSMGFVDG